MKYLKPLWITTEAFSYIQYGGFQWPMLTTDYRRQKSGCNKTRTVSNSSRPSNMAMIEITLPGSLMVMKVCATSPSPGPTLFMHVAIAENAVT